MTPEVFDIQEADEAVAFFAPRPVASPTLKLVAHCAEEVDAYRRQHPQTDNEELLWLLEAENRPIAEFVRWQMAISVTELDQTLIARTALVVSMAYERTIANALTKGMGEPDRPSDGIVTMNTPALAR